MKTIMTWTMIKKRQGQQRRRSRCLQAMERQRNPQEWRCHSCNEFASKLADSPTAACGGNAHGISLTCISLFTAWRFQFKKTDWKSVLQIVHKQSIFLFKHSVFKVAEFKKSLINSADATFGLSRGQNLQEQNHTTENASRVQLPAHKHAPTPYSGTVQSTHFHRLLRCKMTSLFFLM